MTRAHICLLVCLAVLLPEDSWAQSAPDLSHHFVGTDGTFVLLSGATGTYIRHNPERAEQRFTPCSTFKIPHTMIALESGAALSPDFVVRYDPALGLENRGPGGSWGRDHTLRSAFVNSVLWYYQDMARCEGAATLSRYLRRFGYGNAGVSGPVEDFWVGGPLQISANEQVEFLRRFREERLGLSERTTRLTQDIMRVEATPEWTLSGKTGACRTPGDDVALWYVGYVEKGANVYYFALELGDRAYGDLVAQRVPTTMAILRQFDIIPSLARSPRR